jgi:hypothetical protein
MWAGIIYASGTLLTNAFLSALQTNNGDVGLEDFKRKYEAFKYFAHGRSDTVERYREYLTKAFDSPLGDTNPYPMPDNYRDIYGPKVALEMARVVFDDKEIEDENLKQMMIEKAVHPLLDHVFKMLVWQQLFEFWEFAAQRYDYTPTFNVGDTAMTLHDFKSVMLDFRTDVKKIEMRTHPITPESGNEEIQTLHEKINTSTTNNKSNMNELNNLLNIVLKEIGESELNLDEVNDEGNRALEEFVESGLDLDGDNDEGHRGSEDIVDIHKSKYNFLCKLQKWWEDIKTLETADLLNILSSSNYGQQEYANYVSNMIHNILETMFKNVNTGMTKFMGDFIVQKNVLGYIESFVEYDKLKSALIIINNDSEQIDPLSDDIKTIRTKDKTTKELHDALGEHIDFLIANENPKKQSNSFGGFDEKELLIKVKAVYKRVDEIVQHTDQ